MASKRHVALAPRALRQLRRVRSVYLVGALLSLLVLLTQGDGPEAAEGRHAAIAGVLLAVFAALFTVTLVQLRRHGRTVHCGTARKLARPS
ncbi:hypothetical protein [Streptomyces sp. NBC_00102]|uniref:hypothetical protein n=1 Tax=Streptomyces sp. NBC_00102 TaxID=2975652 RepID=UPI002254D7EF|nr:hypothetical protein [Streptomyces sp. NBC_00102]MCX5400442.1 hypothetical protein [Streptomyces sp. NBC_00102]